LLDFDIEIDEPGASIHKQSLKNSNLAICISHPVLVQWMKSRQKLIFARKKINEIKKGQKIYDFQKKANDEASSINFGKIRLNVTLSFF
jgi:hypothetical protein